VQIPILSFGKNSSNVNPQYLDYLKTKAIDADYDIFHVTKINNDNADDLSKDNVIPVSGSEKYLAIREIADGPDCFGISVIGMYDDFSEFLSSIKRFSRAFDTYHVLKYIINMPKFIYPEECEKFYS